MIQNIVNNLSKLVMNNIKSGSCTVNGKTYQGNSISIIDGKVIVDGKVQDEINVPKIEVTVNGDVGEIHNSSGDVTAQNVGEVTTTSGNVKCKEVSGSVKTTSGDVECGNVSKSVSTTSGDVECGKVRGSATTMSGDISHG